MPPLGAPSDVATRLTGLSDGHQNERALREMAALLRCDGSDLVDGEWSAFILASSWSGGLIMVFSLLKKTLHLYTLRDTFKCEILPAVVCLTRCHFLVPF